MRLSEAIRLGAMLRPQGKGDLFGANGTSCALGAAMEAIGLRPIEGAMDLDCSSDEFEEMYHQWPILLDEPDSPIEHPYGKKLAETIPVLNDAGWTRERIADWVATVEDAQEAQDQKEIALALVKG